MSNKTIVFINNKIKNLIKIILTCDDIQTIILLGAKEGTIIILSLIIISFEYSSIS
jgi:hypothetical protein